MKYYNFKGGWSGVGKYQYIFKAKKSGTPFCEKS